MSCWAEAEGYCCYLEPSLKGNTEVDWNASGARRGFLAAIVADAERTLVSKVPPTTPQPVLHQAGFPHQPGGRHLHLSGRRGHDPPLPPGARP